MSDISIGQIIVWEDAVIPENWHICDGTNGTPDLREKFVYGKSSDGESSLTGGASSHSHVGGVSSSNGAHSHGGFSGTTGGASSATSLFTSTVSQFAHGNHTHGFSAGDTTTSSNHEHTTTLNSSSSLPPYIALYYIMKVV